MAEGQGRSPDQGVKLLYIRDYLRKYTNTEHTKNAKDISEYLASKGIRAERKTIYNDILKLQTTFQEPIEYSHKKRGYYISKPQFTTYELQIIVDSVRTANFLSEKETSNICKKISELSNIYDYEVLFNSAWIGDESAKPANSELLNVDLIQQAIRHNKKIRFRYFGYFPTASNRSNNGKEYLQNREGSDFYIVSPNELVHMDDGYMLLCYNTDVRNECMEDFVYYVRNMEDVTILSSDRECFDYPYPSLAAKPQFRVEESLNRYKRGNCADMPQSKEENDNQIQRGIMRAREEILASRSDDINFILDNCDYYTIQLVFKIENAQLVVEEFGEKAVLVPIDNSYCSTTMRMRPSRRFFNWLFRNQTDIRISKPEEVINIYRFYLTIILEQYDLWEMPPDELIERHIDLLFQKAPNSEEVQEIIDKYIIE